MPFKINWDNGAHACGTFPQEFNTEQEADAFGENWIVEMRSADSEATEMMMDDGGYSYEVIEVEAVASIYTVIVHGSRCKNVLYAGDDEAEMYAHVNTIEWTLQACNGSGLIEIVEGCESRWIDYRDGVRD